MGRTGQLERPTSAYARPFRRVQSRRAQRRMWRSKGYLPEMLDTRTVCVATMSLLRGVMRTGNSTDRTELGDLVPDTRFDPEASALEHTLRCDLSGAMDRLLTEREQRFLRAYVGFDTGQKATLEAIGAAEGLTRERVRQVIAGAITKLRDNPLIQAYRTPLERTGSQEEHPR